MKILKKKTLTSEDSLYYDNEPLWRFEDRKISMVLDGYVFDPLTEEDITGIENWEKYSSILFDNYQITQKSIKSEGLKKGWSNCTNAEKDILIDMYCYVDKGDGLSDYNKVVHLMTTKGYTQDQSKGYLLDKWYEHFEKFLGECSENWNSAIKVVISYLTMKDSATMFDSVNGLVVDYLTSSRQGLGYGDSRNGLMNYVESTFGYENNGLAESGFILKRGTWEEFKNDLVSTIVSPYFWDDIKNLYYPDASGLTAIAGTVSGTDLQWYSENLNWEYSLEYGDSGFNIGTGTVLNGALTIGTVSVNVGLTAGNTYDYYVTEKVGNFATVGPLIFIAD